MPLWSGGMDEWPPGMRTITSTSTYPDKISQGTSIIKG